VRISENQDFEKTPDDARREKIGLMIDKEFPGLASKERTILIDIFVQMI
jgi:hypothetical protein